jgi:small subunit ribosomal protein S20
LEEVTLANIKSQIKRNKQNEKRRLLNRYARGMTRAALTDARDAIKTGNVEESEAAVSAALSALDKAAQKGILHKNNAARRKSRLMKKLAALKAEN